MTTARSYFERYLRFEISLTELRSRLGSQWHFERDGNNFELSGDMVLEKPVEVDLQHLINAINLATDDRIPLGALEEWANLLLLSDAYVMFSHQHEHHRENLLQCMHELASPTVLGAIDRSHLLDLKRRCGG